MLSHFNGALVLKHPIRTSDGVGGFTPRSLGRSVGRRSPSRNLAKLNRFVNGIGTAIVILHVWEERGRCVMVVVVSPVRVVRRQAQAGVLGGRAVVRHERRLRRYLLQQQPSTSPHCLTPTRPTTLTLLRINSINNTGACF